MLTQLENREIARRYRHRDPDRPRLRPRPDLPPGTDLPHYVALPTVLGWGYAIDRPGPHGGFLGKRYDPLWSVADPKIDPNPPATPPVRVSTSTRTLRTVTRSSATPPNLIGLR